MTMAPATALLDTTEANARRLLAAGLLAFLAGVLLLVGFSSSAAAVVAGAVVVLGGPLVTFLSGGERTPKQALPPYLAAIALLLVALPVAHHWGLSHVGRAVGWVGLLVGPAYAWTAFRSWRVLGPARSALAGPTFDVRLEVLTRKGYMGAPYTEARLWPTDSDSWPPLVRFGWHRSSTGTEAVDKAPAQVHGVPEKGAVVAVCSADAALIGRVRASRFGEPTTSPKPPSALVRWLWKPRSIRLP